MCKLLFQECNLLNIKNELNAYELEPRLKTDENVIHYWNNKKTEFPILNQLALILLAVPATQVSVERAFSSLKFILSPQRSRMDESLLENVLLIRNNHFFCE